MTVYTSDNFLASAGTLLSAHTSESGQTWLALAESSPPIAADDIYLIGNGIFRSNTASLSNGGASVANITPSTADYSVQATYTNVGGYTDVNCNYGIMGRTIGVGTTSFSGYQFLFENGGPHFFTLYRYDSGTPTALAHYDPGALLAIGASFVMRLSMTGSTINCYVNGVLRITFTDATYTAAGKGGITTYHTGNSDTVAIQGSQFSIFDSVIAPINGYAVGSPTFSTVTSPHGSFANTALTLNGTSQYAIFPGIGGYMAPASGSSLTVELWFRSPSDPGSGQQVLLAESSPQSSNAALYNFDLYQTGGNVFFQQPGGTGSIYPSSALVDGNWHHLAGVITGGVMKLFVDGVGQTASSSFTQVAGIGGNLLVGAFNALYYGLSPSLFTNGQIQEVAVWNTAKYSSNFTPPTAPYAGNEANLTNLYHLTANLNDAVNATPATAMTLTGPSSGFVSLPSDNFTVGLDGNYTGTITPSDGAGGTFTPSSLTYSNSSANQTFKYTPSSAGAKSISVSASPSLTAPSPVSFTAINSTTIAPNDSAWLTPAGNSEVNSTHWKTNNPGAYRRIKYAGASHAVLKFDLTGITAGTAVPLIPYGQIKIRVDGGSWTSYAVAQYVTISIPSASPGSYKELEIAYSAWSGAGDRWDGTQGTIVNTAFYLDSGATVQLPTARPHRILFYKDSTGEGAAILDPASPAGMITTQDATLALPYLLGPLLNAEVTIVAFSGQGVVYTGNFPYNLPTTYQNLWNSGPSRALTGYNLVIWGEGQNDGSPSFTATFISSMTTMINAFQSASPSTQHLVLQDFRNCQTSGEQGCAFATSVPYLAGNSQLVCTNNNSPADYNPTYSYDLNHPNSAGTTLLIQNVAAVSAPLLGTIFYEDTFTGSASSNLTSHTPNVGTGYTQSSALTGVLDLDGAGNIYNVSGSGCALTVTVPAIDPPDYQITFDVVLQGVTADGDTAGWVSRATSSLSSFNKAIVTNVSGTLKFIIGTSANATIASVNLPTPILYPTVFTCTLSAAGSDLVGTVSGGGLTSVQTLTATGQAVSSANTAHGPLLSPGTPSTKMNVSNALGAVNTQTIAISSGNLSNFGPSQEMWDTTSVGSGYISNLLPGGQLDMNVTIVTPGVVTLNCDTSLTAKVYIYLVVDGTPVSTTTIQSGTSTISTGSLSAGTHRIKFYNKGGEDTGSRWVMGASSGTWRVTGVTIPVDATLAASSRPSNYALFVGDSITEGYHNDSGPTTNNYDSWTNQLSLQLGLANSGTQISGIGVEHAGINYPVGALAFAGSGYPTDGTSDGWDHIHSTLARSFIQTPQFVALCVGTNEWATDPLTPGHGSPTDANSEDIPFQANLVLFITRVRGKLPTTPLFLCIPYTGCKRVPIQAAVAQYKASNPSESQLFVFDMAWGSPNLKFSGPSSINEYVLFEGLTKNFPDDSDTIPSAQAPDRTHPYAATDLQIATVFNPLFTALGNVAPSKSFASGIVSMSFNGNSVTLSALPPVGGSAPYTFQFQTSTDNGATWSSFGSSISNQSATINPNIQVSGSAVNGQKFRLQIIDQSNTPQTVYSNVLTAGSNTGGGSGIINVTNMGDALVQVSGGSGYLI